MEKENKSKIYYNGSVWKTTNCGTFTIIGKGKKSSRYLCKFDDGTIIDANTSSIRTGNIKNPNKPSVCGVGFIGIGKFNCKYNKISTKEYTIWRCMILRCYSKKYHKNYPSYSNCTVDERWHNFQNFCEDIQYLEGYNEWKNSETKLEYHLDKDYKVKGNKIYSRDTCMFITGSLNSSITDNTNRLTGLTYIGIRLEDGYTEEFINQKEFARKWGLNSSTIAGCLKFRHKTTKGWTFKIK